MAPPSVSFAAVLPSIWPEWTDACLNTMDDELRGHLLVVDNTVDNRGVGASWNLGIGVVEDFDFEWLLILSAAMRFGTPGGLDFLRSLEENPDAWAIEAHPHFGWHCIAFHRRTLDAIGRFDENFFAYWEDIDYSYRFALYRGLPTSGIVEPFWRKVEPEATFAGYAHGINLAGVRPDHNAMEAYYTAKWGGGKGEETFTRPFDDPEHDLTWWPEEGDPRAMRRGL